MLSDFTQGWTLAIVQGLSGAASPGSTMAAAAHFYQQQVDT